MKRDEIKAALEKLTASHDRLIADVEALKAQVEVLVAKASGGYPRTPTSASAKADNSAGDIHLTGRIKLAQILGVDIGELEFNISRDWIIKAFKSIYLLFGGKVIKIKQNQSQYCYPDGYLNKKGVQHLVNTFLESRGSDERYQRSFVLYENGQQNWLVGTQSLIVYILEESDDSYTTEDNIKWMLPKEDREPIEIDEDDETVSIGPMKYWRYDPDNFDNGADLKNQIRSL
jgi:hypothetical protein